MVSALDLKGSGSNPGRVIVLCSWARHFTLIVPLSTQGNLTKCWEVTCDRLASRPGGVAIFLVASCCGGVGLNECLRIGPKSCTVRTNHYTI